MDNNLYLVSVRDRHPTEVYSNNNSTTRYPLGIDIPRKFTIIVIQNLRCLHTFFSSLRTQIIFRTILGMTILRITIIPNLAFMR